MVQVVVIRDGKVKVKRIRKKQFVNPGRYYDIINKNDEFVKKKFEKSRVQVIRALK